MDTYTKHARAFLPLAILTGLLSVGLTTSVHAQLSAIANPPGEKQCATSDINDNDTAVGNCSPQNVYGPSEGFADNGDLVSPLQPLVVGQDCSAGGVADNGTIIGECVDLNNKSFGVTWNAANPLAAPVLLQPLPGLLNLDPDVTTASTGYNQSGFVVGESISGTGNATPVVWNPSVSGGSPMMLATQGSNCEAADISDTALNGEPDAVLNCPLNPTSANPGPMVAEISIYQPGLLGLLGSYVATALPIPSGATHCTADGINKFNQIVGTCHFPAPDLPQTAYWASPTSAPTLLTVPIGGNNARNAGAFINNAIPAAIVFHYQTNAGVTNPGFWIPSTNTVTLIPPLPGGLHAIAVCLGDNNTVVINSDIASEYGQAVVWTPTGGDLDEGDLNGGDNSAATSCNEQGTALSAVAEGGNLNANASEDLTIP
ncbi:hypothetical protein GCM10007862_10460 [Dyella lipolytica]|uniref:Uncharacterized protein n=1 Tax=Dyella lipolytica TaxID=1867835 RepID=A0ABW8IXH3_9GAMM|nr:hypothetical protein [Dyella lipolytica]GLQ45995.1 hypothetical protein GCM10007862_10460 [Dyella lipolytica]